jgi:hypothetical protein
MKTLCLLFLLLAPATARLFPSAQTACPVAMILRLLASSMPVLY